MDQDLLNKVYMYLENEGSYNLLLYKQIPKISAPNTLRTPEMVLALKVVAIYLVQREKISVPVTTI